MNAIAQKITLWQIDLATWILRFLKVPEAVASIHEEELGDMMAGEIDARIPLTRMAEIDGRASLLIDDVEQVKELIREYAEEIINLKARVERLENEAEDR